ncbi:MAG: class I SAM-dependent methyltransferase [Planctomycetes bacterium]|nr:class I SAM-dependent methyltransferase [Planctomycetota bacterium]
MSDEKTPAGNGSDSPPRRKHRLRRLMEFKGIRRLSLGQYNKRIRKLYDGPAGAMLAFGSMISLHEPLVGRLIRSGKFDVTQRKQILDVGSGAGQILKHMVKKTMPDARLVAFDLSQKMLARARTRLKSDRPKYVAGDLMRMPFADESFDCVTCGWVIEHLPDPRPGLLEVKRVLKPGGSVLILATEDTFCGAIVSRTWKCRTYNRKEFKAACDETGLPWKRQLWFTPFHRLFRMGGILVEAQKPAAVDA